MKTFIEFLNESELPKHIADHVDKFFDIASAGHTHEQRAPLYKEHAKEIDPKDRYAVYKAVYDAMEEEGSFGSHERKAIEKIYKNKLTEK